MKNIDYQLDKAYQGFYRDISRMITEQLTMAYYRMLEYRKTEKLSKDEEMVLGRMVALEGIFRTILLKRLESSVEVFRKSVSNHINFLEKFKEYLKKGKFLFWFFYDLLADEKITNKTKILDYICCPSEEVREIPDFFEKVYDLNSETIKGVEEIYKEVEQREIVDSAFGELNSDKSKKFVSTLIREIDLRMDEYLLDFAEDIKIEEKWEKSKGKLLTISLTKKRLQKLRAIWKNYKNNHKGWKRLLSDLSEFLEGKLSIEREEVPPYNPQLLKLITIDFVS